MRGLFSRIGLGWMLLVLVACQTANVPPPPEPLPKLISSLKRDGKGVPNGRSDSLAPFLRPPHFEPATDVRYGFFQASPVLAGPFSSRNHLLFLNALRGPNGEPVEYERLGSCCAYADPDQKSGYGLLDLYVVKFDGTGRVVHLYVDMYRTAPMRVPAGFTARH